MTTMRFLHFSDLHMIEHLPQEKSMLFLDDSRQRYEMEVKKSYENILEHIKSHKNLDFVIFTGDTISSDGVKNDPDDSDFIKGWLQKLDALNIPIYFIYGDARHDGKDGENLNYFLNPLDQWNNIKLLKPNKTAEINNGIIVCADKENKNSYDKLCEDLGRLEGQNTFIFVFSHRENTKGNKLRNHDYFGYGHTHHLEIKKNAGRPGAAVSSFQNGPKTLVKHYLLVETTDSDGHKTSISPQVIAAPDVKVINIKKDDEVVEFQNFDEKILASSTDPTPEMCDDSEDYSWNKHECGITRNLSIDIKKLFSDDEAYYVLFSGTGAKSDEWVFGNGKAWKKHLRFLKSPSVNSLWGFVG